MSEIGEGVREKSTRLERTILLSFLPGTRFYTKEPEPKQENETRSGYAKRVTSQADWESVNRTFLKVSMQDVKDKKDWILCQIIRLGKNDLGKPSKNGENKLEVGQIVQISRGAYDKAFRKFTAENIDKEQKGLGRKI